MVYVCSCMLTVEKKITDMSRWTRVVTALVASREGLRMKW